MCEGVGVEEGGRGGVEEGVAEDGAEVVECSGTT